MTLICPFLGIFPDSKGGFSLYFEDSKEVMAEGMGSEVTRS